MFQLILIDIAVRVSCLFLEDVDSIKQPFSLGYSVLHISLGIEGQINAIKDPSEFRSSKGLLVASPSVNVSIKESRLTPKGPTSVSEYKHSPPHNRSDKMFLAAELEQEIDGL